MASTRARLMASSMICGAAALTFAGAAMAQDTGQAPGGSPTPAPAADQPQELVVTGSRIPSPNLTSVSPVTAINNQEVKLEGTTRVEDLVNNLPQVFANQGSTVSNGSTGTATVDLRGLGPKRTLVLIDGRRLVPGDVLDPVPDLNFIPAQLIERVDVVTGGASAVYGADAVAGVVNFIMMKNFEGVRLDAQYSIYQHHNGSDVQDAVKAHGYPLPDSDVWDGATVDLTGIIGINSPDGKGNATVYATYRHTDPIVQSSRDYSACTLSAGTFHNLACVGSGTSAYGHFIDFDDGNQYTLTPPDGGDIRAYSAGTDAFNYGPYNYYQRNDERYTFGTFAHYEVNKAADVYAQLMFMDDHTNSLTAPSGVFGNTIAVPCNDPLLTAAEVATLCTANGLGPNDHATGGLLRRNVEGGGRVDDLRHTDYRIVTGVRGDLGKGFSYDVYGQYAVSVYSENQQNFFSDARVLQALNVTTDANGNVICADPAAVAQGCVPYNPFVAGGVTPAALNYVQVPALSQGTTTEAVVDANVTGDLGKWGIKSPWASEGVAVNFGGEYRRETLNFLPDLESQATDANHVPDLGGGVTKTPANGAYDVSEGFAEIRIPLVEDMPFFHLLQFEGGYRYSDYSTKTTTSTYKLGGEWAPIPDIRFRASYNRAVRAPNILELYTPQVVGLGLDFDPCEGTAPTLTLAQCENTHVTAAQYGHIIANSAPQYNALFGGNPNLKPEIASTWSAGVVLTPRYLPGFNMSLDYFNIDVQKAIQPYSADATYLDCAYSGLASYCDLVHRAAVTGSLWLGNSYVSALSANIGFVKTSGLDVSVNYRLPLSSWNMERVGAIDLSLVGTWLQHQITDPGLPLFSSDGTTIVATQYDCKGYFGVPNCGTPNPEWRHRLRVGWTTPWAGVTVSGSWRFFSQVTNVGLSSNPYLQTAVAPADVKIHSQSYFDLAATWRVRDNYTLRLGVNNIFDKDPPVVTGAAGGTDVRYNGNTYPGVYDSLGRYMFIGITADF